ncbi:hypothetical protein [Micromonospora sp. LH3U1]|uniref:hypothetical protein n=1 Tax=Micromonospora sp. LH3U1 TaxID=3018339 RepID=UPI00234A1203|nr:hypothetical protein [Micromonospora sp. LH3U1]WCN82565.1 hypothetical protein PCA76_05660 [Micromonospora sp. LH3U1]
MQTSDGPQWTVRSAAVDDGRAAELEGSVADEDRTRSDSGAGDAPLDGPARPCRRAVTAGQTRTALRRVARARQRRRWAVEGVAVLVCLVALISYVSSRSDPDSGGQQAGPGGVPAGAARGTGLPAADGRTGEAGPALPGLRPRQRPPSPDPTPSPSAPAPPPVSPESPESPALSVSRGEMPAEVDLTAVGTRDWMHWGERGDNSTVRKRSGSGEIIDGGGAGNRVRWDGNQEHVRWSDGSSDRSTSGTSNGVYTCGAGNGFTLAVAGSGEPRTVQLYGGIWMARGRLEARLSSGGPASTAVLEDPYNSQSAQFTIRFTLPKRARLLLTWTVEKVFTSHCGNVGLQAVAVR